MVKIDKLNPQPENNHTESADQPDSTLTNPPTNQNPSTGLFSLPPSVMKLVPWIPLLLEMTTGQKVPQMSGTMADMQMTLVNIQTGMQTIVNNQQQLAQRLTNLENNATHQFNNLIHQFKNLRLTHTKEQKQLEYNNSSHLEEENQDY